jgi:hypothetical protein
MTCCPVVAPCERPGLAVCTLGSGKGDPRGLQRSLGFCSKVVAHRTTVPFKGMKPLNLGWGKAKFHEAVRPKTCHEIGTRHRPWRPGRLVLKHISIESKGDNLSHGASSIGLLVP